MIGPELLVAGVIFTALVVYVITGGADFGGGVWDLLAPRANAKAHRALIAKAIGPIWEANHVWLILVIVLLFVCFPKPFSVISIALHLPLTAMLVGVVLRGSSFVFRAYDTQRDEVHQRWSLVFSVSSLFTPVMLGICVGAVASGRVRLEQGLVPDGFVGSWLHPFALSVGLFTLALFAFLAACYLAVEATELEMKEAYRVRALGSSVAVVVLAWASLWLSRADAPHLWEGLLYGTVAHVLQLGIAVVGLVGFWAVYSWWYRVARALTVLQVALLIGAWAQAQWPMVLPPDLTLANSAAPANVLWSVLAVLGAGSLLLVPAYLWLLSVFKGGVVGR